MSGSLDDHLSHRDLLFMAASKTDELRREHILLVREFIFLAICEEGRCGRRRW